MEGYEHAPSRENDMNRYCRLDDTQRCPVDDGAAKALMTAGSISPVTKVRREDTERNWFAHMKGDDHV